MGSPYCWLDFTECPVCTCISTVVHILLRSASAFSVCALGLHTSEKEIHPLWKVWVLMHVLLRHMQQLLLDPCWNDFHDRRKKKCPGLKELMWIINYEVAPKASCSQIFGVTLRKNHRKGLDPSHSRKFKSWTLIVKREITESRLWHIKSLKLYILMNSPYQEPDPWLLQVGTVLLTSAEYCHFMGRHGI